MRHLPVFPFALLTTLTTLTGAADFASLGLVTVTGALAGPAGPAELAELGARAHAQDVAVTGSRAPSASRRRASRSRAPSVVVSFPGFGMNADGTSRCFVHVAGTLTPETHASGRRFEVLLPGATVAARNHLNPLETRFFNTPMLRARLVRRGRNDLVLVVDLRADVAVSMRTEADASGGTLVVVDLPAGAFVTAPPRIGQPWDEDSSENGDGSRRLRDGTGSVRPSSGGERDGVTPSTAPETRPSQAPANPPARTAEPPSRPPPPASGSDSERPPMFGQ